jgi:hypothetical protein
MAQQHTTHHSTLNLTPTPTLHTQTLSQFAVQRANGVGSGRQAGAGGREVGGPAGSARRVGASGIPVLLEGGWSLRPVTQTKHFFGVGVQAPLHNVHPASTGAITCLLLCSTFLMHLSGPLVLSASSGIAWHVTFLPCVSAAVPHCNVCIHVNITLWSSR